MSGSRFQSIGNITRRFVLGVMVTACLNLMLPSSRAATLTTLVSFNGANGSEPLAELIADAAGNLYGTTYSGGTNSTGTVFRFSTATNTLTTLASFAGSFSGAKNPRAGLVTNATGNLYGTTERGGEINRGTVFRFNTATNTLTTLASFDGENGSTPYAGLIGDAAGNLFGTTFYGGESNLGTLFRLDTATNILTTLVSFDGANGSAPFARLIADAAGNLYGTTDSGGAGGVCPGGCGTMFRIDTATNTLTTLVSFGGANGAHPRAELLADASGNIFGTTPGGGASNRGTVFRLDAATNTLTTLVSFYGANGSSPSAGLITDAAGNLYGTTLNGGTNNLGTVFRVDATTNTLTTLASFAYFNNGANPRAKLIADAAGNLYGTTSGGGIDDRGTIFRVSDAGFVVVPEPGSLMILFSGVGWIGLRQLRARLSLRDASRLT